MIDDYDVLLDSLSTPKPKGSKTRPTVDFRQLYNDVGRKHGVDPDLLYNQAKHESINFNPNFVFGPGRSPKGAAGIAQFMPDTARKYGLYVGKGRDDRFNPEKAADAHARLMKDLIDKYGDNRLALAAYNAGTGFTPQQARRAMQNIPETRNYVQKIAPQGDQYDQLLDNVGQQPSVPQSAQPKGDEYDDLLDSIAPLKTPKVTSTVSPLDETPDVGAPVKAVQFKKGTTPVSLNPVEDVYEATSGGKVMPKGIAGLQARRYEFTPSQEVGGRVTLPLPKDSVPNEDAVVDAYLGTLGKDYVELGKRYKAETGHNILSLGGGALKQDDKGNYYVRPTKGAVDFLNAYAKGSDVAAQEAHRQADELIAAQNKAYEAAKPDVVEARAAMLTGKDSPFLRGMIGGTAGAAQAVGSVLPGSLGNEFERQAAVERAASEQLSKESPLTTTSEKVKAGIGGLIPTAAMLIATHKLGPAQLAALGILEGSTPEERLRGGLQGASAQAVLGGAPAAFNEVGLPTTGKIVTGGAMVGQPAFEAWQRGESPTQAIVENLPFAALPFLHSKFGRVESVEDQSGVPKGEIRVREVDNPEATHVIIKPSTMRNQSAIPLKPETDRVSTSQPAELSTPPPSTAIPEQAALGTAEQLPEAAQPAQAKTTATPPAPQEGAREGKPRLLRRIDEPGNEADLSKPQGLYTTPAEYESPHKDLGGKETLYEQNPDARVLTIDPSSAEQKASVMRRGAVDAGAGVHAARILLGEAKFREWKSLTKSELTEQAKEIDPSVKWGDRAYDAQDVMEQIGGVLAREAGYDILEYADKQMPEFSEVALLTPKAAKPVAPAPPIEEAKPTAPTEGVSEPESTTSIKNASVEAARELKDLPGLTPADYKGWEEAGERARAQGLDQPDKADAIAEQVVKGTKKQLTDEESAGLRDRLRGIDNQYEDLLRQVENITDPERLAELKIQGDALREKSQSLTDATKKGGTEIARALAIRRSAVDQNMLLTQLGAERSYKLETGKEPSEQAKRQIADLIKQNKDLISKITEHEERLKNNELSQTVDKIRRDVERESRRQGRKQAQATLDAEAADLKQQFAAAWKKIATQKGVQPSVFARIDPEGELVTIAAKLVRNRVQANIGIKAEALVDEIHGLLKDVADLNKRDIRELISGYGRPVKRQSELQRQLNSLKSELTTGLRQEDISKGLLTEKRQGPTKGEARQLPMEGPRKSEASRSGQPLQGPRLSEGQGIKEGPQLGKRQGPTLREGVGKPEGPELGAKQGPSNRWPARKAQLERQIAEVERRIREQDFSEKAKRGATVYDAEGNRLRAKLENVQRDFQRLKEANKKTTVADALVRWKRFAVLTYGTTIGKLTSAASGRMAMTPVYETAGQIGKAIPGLRSTFADEPSFRAFLKGEKAAVMQLWQGDSFRDFLSHLKGGEDMIGLLYGKEGSDEFIKASGGKTYIPRTMGEVMDRPGHYHAALKTIPKRAAFFRAFERGLQKEIEKPNPRDIRDPTVQLAIAGETKAFQESQRAILQQKNWVTSLFNSTVGTLGRSDYRGARALGKLLQFRYPITKVPVNYVGESALHIAGLPAGLGEVAIRGASAKLRPAMEASRVRVIQGLAERMPAAMDELAPEQRQRIARAIKVGGVGLGFVVWGAMRPDQFGGYYQPGKRDPRDLQFGGMKFLGINIPRWMGHIPPLEAAQFGATMRRVYDSMRAKGKDEIAAREGVKAATKGLAEEIPFNQDSLIDVMLGPEAKGQKLVGGEIRSVIPGAVQQVAKASDYPKGTSLVSRVNPFGTAEPTQRKPQSVTQEVEMGVPGLRQRVPVNERLASQAKKARLLQDYRAGKITKDDLNAKAQSGELTKSEVQAITKQGEMTPRQAAFSNARPMDALDRYERMSDVQKAEVQQIMERHAWTLTHSDSLTDAQKQKYQERLDALGITPAPPRKRSSSPFSRRFLSAP